MGFGDFDVCLTVLTAKKGNVKLAMKMNLWAQSKGSNAVSGSMVVAVAQTTAISGTFNHVTLLRPPDKPGTTE